MKDFWKLPGGLVDPGEDIAAAAVREVKEETGVDAEFVSIAAFRETHQGPFGTSDLYCVCVLKLADHYKGKLPEPMPEEKEIAAAEWMDLDAFLSSKYYAKGLYGEMLRSAAGTAKEVMGGTLQGTGLQVTKLSSLGGRMESLYHAGVVSKL